MLTKGAGGPLRQFYTFCRGGDRLLASAQNTMLSSEWRRRWRRQTLMCALLTSTLGEFLQRRSQRPKRIRFSLPESSFPHKNARRVLIRMKTFHFAYLCKFGLGANYHLYGVGMQSTIEQQRTDLGLIKLFYSCRDTRWHTSQSQSPGRISLVHLERPIIILARCSNRIIYILP